MITKKQLNAYARTALEDRLKIDNSYKLEGFSLTEPSSISNALANGILTVGHQLRPKKKFTKEDLRKAYEDGMTVGVGIGSTLDYLQLSSITARESIEENERYRDFYEEFLELCRNYEVGFGYHPDKGVTIVDTAPEGKNKRYAHSEEISPGRVITFIEESPKRWLAYKKMMEEQRHFSRGHSAVPY